MKPNPITETTTHYDYNVTVVLYVNVTVSSETDMSTEQNVNETSKSVDVMMIIKFIVSFIGIVGNLTVLIVFLNCRKFRKKIPNIYIINQVSFVNIYLIYCTNSYTVLSLHHEPSLLVISSHHRKGHLHTKFYENFFYCFLP